MPQNGLFMLYSMFLRRDKSAVDTHATVLFVSLSTTYMYIFTFMTTSSFARVFPFVIVLAATAVFPSFLLQASSLANKHFSGDPLLSSNVRMSLTYKCLPLKIPQKATRNHKNHVCQLLRIQRAGVVSPLLRLVQREVPLHYGGA